MNGGGDHRVTARPPYYAVIFTSIRADGDDAGYAAASARMIELAGGMDGFLGVDSARDGIGITVSYWQDEASIVAWRRESEHAEAQRRGRGEWYAAFQLRVCRVEREYGYTAPARPLAE